MKRTVRIASTVLGGVVAAVGCLMLIGFVFDRLSEARDRRAYPPSGRLVDAGTARLNLDCRGPIGGPTIVLEAGGGDISTIWRKVQPQLSLAHRTCAYDRAGQGWSGPSSQPRYPEMIARELRSALAAAGERPPFLLVGHSRGGVYARTFAQTFPSETAGLVLLDSSVDGLPSAPPPLELEERQAELIQMLRPLAPFGVARLAPGAPAEGADPAARAEAAMRRTAGGLMANADELAALSAGHTGPPVRDGALGATPVVVVTSRGPLKGLDRLAPDGQRKVAEYRRAYQASQAAFARLSRCGRQIFADRSGHYIHLDQPELVLAVIEAALARECTK